ncbi:MAG: hypothetical protein ACNA8H_13935, partial [Anaerolineales bacterium]
EDIEGAIIRFQDRLSFPMMVDLGLDWGEYAVWDVYPKKLPDLYADQPLILSGRCSIDSEKPLTFKLRGRRGSETLTLDATLRLLDQPETSIQRLWARKRVDDLLEEGKLRNLPVHETRDQVIGLAMQHRLVTPYTSFVAVDSQVVTDRIAEQQILIAQPLPEGLDRDGFISSPDLHLISKQSMTRDVLYQTDDSDRDLEILQAHKVYEVLSIEPPASPADEIPQRELIFPKEFTLRELARKQKLNGSWDDDIEQTAAALLAFLRGGHTPRRGHFRTQLRRTVEWLLAVPASGSAAFLKAYALHQLADVTAGEHAEQAAEQLKAALPQPTGRLQRAIWAYLHDDPFEQDLPTQIDDLEDLWLAVIFRLTDLSISTGLADDADSRLVETLQAGLT